MSWRPTLVTAGLAAVATAGLLGLATDGFRAFTAESARRLAVAAAPVPLPEVALIDARGAAYTLADPAGRLTVVEFIYTSCPDICRVQAERFADLLTLITARGLEDRVRLASVSFDTAGDGPAELAEFARRHGADGAVWAVLRPAPEAALEPLLDAAGVVVLPDGWGGWVHNAAMHLVDGAGRLVGILDIDDEAGLLARLPPPPPEAPPARRGPTVLATAGWPVGPPGAAPGR